MMKPEDYVNVGWRIFPCYSIVNGVCSCNRGVGCNSPGKHPIIDAWQKNASADLAVVHQWWTMYPTSNIGLATGSMSGLFVVDIDQGHGGFDSMDEYEAYEPLPETLTAISGGGGRHLYYRYPDDGAGLPTRSAWLPGVDIRGDRGLIIVDPSNHISGRQYRWENWGTPLAEAPSHLLESIRESDKPKGGKEGGASGRKTDPTQFLNGYPEGERDKRLFDQACAMRRDLENAGYSDEASKPLVLMWIKAAAAACSPPFPERDAEIKVDSAYKQDHTDKTYELNFVGYSDDNPANGDDDFVTENFTDRGNRNRFIRKYGDDLRYVPEMGWFLWSDIGWKAVTVEIIKHMAEKVADMLKEELDAEDDLRAKKKIFNHLMATEGSARIDAIEKMARSHPKVIRYASEFDSNKYELACRNGIVDLRTGNIRPFSRDDLVTKNTGIVYDPTARSAQWDNFLETATQGDKELQTYLQRAAGYTATGLNVEECFFVIVGPKASGKSTYMNALQGCLGSYSSTVQSDVFMYHHGKDAPANELARLAGKRLVSVSEIREGASFNEMLMKQISGGDPLSARFLYQNTFEFDPQFKIWFATNHDPAAKDDAMMRRIKRIQFMHTIPEKQRDTTLKTFLKDKESGSRVILAWIVQGAVDYIRSGGLAEPQVITESVRQYAEENDTYGKFASELLIKTEGQWTWLSDLFTLWRTWNKEMGTYAGTPQTFKQKIIERYREEPGVELVRAEDGREFIRGVGRKVQAGMYS